MSERGSTNIGQMEAAAQAAVERNKAKAYTKAYAENDTRNAAEMAAVRVQAIETRAGSVEVAALNDRAELEIFGSRGRTYTNPETGEVIATPEKPIAGVIEDMRHSPQYGKTEAERNAAADNYATDIQIMLDDGFELCQAKLIQDLSEKDLNEGIGNLTGKFISEGMNPQKAYNKALKIYDDLDDKRYKMIKEGGAFTAEDYARLRKGKAIYAPDGTPVIPETDEERAAREAREKEQKEREIYSKELTKEALYDLAYGLENYVRLSAGRERVTLSKGGEFTDKNVETARTHYETLRNEAKRLSVASMEEAGYTPAEIVLRSRLDDVTEARIIASRIRDERIRLAQPKAKLAASRIRDERAKLADPEKGKAAERKAKAYEGLAAVQIKFYDLWVRLGGGDTFRKRLFGNFAKGAIIAVPSVPLGLLLAPVAGVGLAAAGAAAAARGVARGFAVGRIDKNADARRVATMQAFDRHRNQVNLIDNSYRAANTPDSITDVYKQATDKEVRRNRKRIALAAGIGAVSATLAGAVAGHMPDVDLSRPSWLQWPGSDENGGNGKEKGGAGGDEGPKKGKVKGDHAEKPEIVAQGKTFKVERGNGIINEIDQYAEARGKHLDDAEAHKLYERVHKKFGRKILDRVGTSRDSYLHNGEVRIASPGPARWFPGVEKFIADEIEKIEKAA